MKCVGVRLKDGSGYALECTCKQISGVFLYSTPDLILSLLLTLG